ncbi:Penicillin-binding protein 2 [Candidatus Providencia siddallii]|uniref:Peptidoglycan D,D-transpeptidase MrdA n=1 Tax=Candidatus Providencia siddallii TaxID=1715285 RepID=A0A0M6W9A7_9GAMM|nr:Penicillin-binding protein 2 [Candidatus Providencia siddallii]
MKKYRYSFRDYTAESTLFIRRTFIAFIVIVILISIIIINLYRLQIVHHEEYKTRSNDNRIKLVPISPSRGIIYDRMGRQLALNNTFYQLEIIPEKIENLQKTFNNLRDIVDLTNEDIINFEKERKRSRKFTSISLKNQLSEVQVAHFAVNQHRFPGLEIKSYQRRLYPYGSALTHVIGYVAKINDKDIDRLDKEDLLSNYSASRDIGKLGIERYYENILHGKTGYEEVEVNNRGRIIRQLHEQSPQAGRDIYLTIDLELQIYIEKILTTSRAAVIVTDPRNGEILALVSNPSYDPNQFVTGISSKDYQSLLHNSDKPLINRATQGLYPPASTIKPFISVAALSEKVITPNTFIFDPGWWQLPGSEKRYRDWKRWGHGKLNIVKSIIESSDTFFYQIAYDMGIDRLSEWMTNFGFGEYTGIDITEERTGIMPTREWKQKRYKKPWYQGDTIPIGIGQGYWTATPIQISNALMMLINNGYIKTPHLLYSTKLGDLITFYKDKKTKQINGVNSNFWDIVKQGMYGVANATNGTGKHNFFGTTYKVAAKSGTAQVFSYDSYNANKVAEHLRDHKLMIAYAPYEKPSIAIAIILENGGVGLSVGDLVRQIFDFILLHNNKNNLK